MKKINDWTEKELKTYIFSRVGCRPHTRAVIDCPICGEPLRIIIHAFDGKLEAFCNGYQCIKIQE